jgi:hypothetical protein
MPYTIDFEDGEDGITVSQEIYDALDDWIIVCEDCSSEFSSSLVAHPAEGKEEDVMKVIRSGVIRNSVRNLPCFRKDEMLVEIATRLFAGGYDEEINGADFIDDVSGYIEALKPNL